MGFEDENDTIVKRVDTFGVQQSQQAVVIEHGIEELNALAVDVARAARVRTPTNHSQVS
jgi:hypothetical protein